MAFKSFSKLSTRNQSTLVSQLYDLVSYYSEVFCPRKRVYIKKLSQEDGTIYWLEGNDKKLIAAAIVDPNYKFHPQNVELTTIGHTVSKSPGQMERIFAHILSDHDTDNLIFLCKPFVAESINVEEMGLVGLSPIRLQKLWPELANIKTDYFNVENETLAEGLSRKQHFIYIKLNSETKSTLGKSNAELIDCLNNPNSSQE